MMKRTIYITFAALVLGLFNHSCTTRHVDMNAGSPVAIDSLVPVYSHSFRVDYYKGFKVISVFSGKDNKTMARYMLCTGKDTPPGFIDAVIVKYPIRRVVCMSTTHVGAMKLLDARMLIAAVVNPDLICDSLVTAMIGRGEIKVAGKDFQPDYEAIAQVGPDMLFSDGENSSSSQMFAKMKALGIKVACSRDYFEQEPLARAEWIRFFAAFIGKEKLADSIFKAVESDYQSQIRLVAEIRQKPRVFCNIPYSGVWYMPCGENYVAKLITDAGGDFLWNNDKPMNGLNLTLNFEQVYERAADADFWINPGTCDRLEQLSNADAKFRLFKAFKSGKVFNGTGRLSRGGGMDIWETGTYTPNIVLHDLIQILHPDASIPCKLYYYRQLK